MAKLYLIGTGPGSSDYLTVAAVQATKFVDVLVGSQRALTYFRFSWGSFGAPGKEYG